MCGITGIYNLSRQSSREQLQNRVDAMTDSIAHRGPDSRGTWIDAEAGIALGHRRLAIRELSALGHQPMISSCGRFVLVYNGEVYSHLEITQDLIKVGRVPKGHSDTEVILEACAEWGVEKTVKRLIGMFAFALYDRQEHLLYLVRDRLGIKPIYWGKLGDLFIFGSELKTLRAVPEWQPKVDRNAVAAFMRHNYVPAPHSIYQNIQKLEPGCILKIAPSSEPQITRFWDLDSVFAAGQQDLPQASDTEMVNALDILLSDAVKRRMVADVPLGALLSGGVDSSLVTALMQQQSERPINTFSIGFKENEYNEAPYAKAIASHLGTNHTELYVEPQHALSMIDHMQHWYDEPFADSSQIPTMLVCELTKKYVTVVLSGDGGDELFAGYNRYLLGLDAWKKASLAPPAVRKLFANSILKIKPAHYDKLAGWLPKLKNISQFGHKLHKLAHSIKLAQPNEMYRRMLSHWDAPDNLVINGREYKGILWDEVALQKIPNFLDRMQFLDTVTYLPDDILTKVDRASMRVALEARVPLIDHRVVEFAWRLPRHLKLRQGETKWALRQVLYRRVPRELIERPKMGFGVPLEHWLRGPLKEWAENLLAEKRLKNQGLLRPELIRERWQAHLKGANWAYPLWDVLMLQAWLDANPGLL